MMSGCITMSNEQQPEKPTIQFPCEDYHISVVADTHDGFVTILEEIVSRHCEGYQADQLRVIASKNGKYQSFRFSITAESEEQLKNLHQDLKATGRVHMVL
jgi:putative lipoic acid-binding regulatory protein